MPVVMKPIPSAEYLRTLLRYDPATGKLYWRERGREQFKTIKGWQTFDRFFAGKEAGGVRGREKRVYLKLPEGVFMAHRIAWTMYHGSPPEHVVDHIDGDPSNDRINNLRAVSFAVNGRNRRAPSNNTSGVSGVSWYTRAARWRGNVRMDGKVVWQKFFKTLDEAAVATRAKRLELGFTERHGT